MTKIAPELGEVWTITGLSKHGRIGSYVQGNISDFYSDWEQVNGKEAEVFEKISSFSNFNYKIRLTECSVSPTYPEGIWTVVSRTYLGDRLKNATGLTPFTNPKTCCNPLTGVCVSCKAEFHEAQEAKGLRFNRWTKLWDKAL